MLHLALKQKSLLTAVHSRKRLAMAHADRKRVGGQLCFGEMSQYSSSFKMTVGCLRGEGYRNSCVVPTVKFGGGGVRLKHEMLLNELIVSF